MDEGFFEEVTFKLRAGQLKFYECLGEEPSSEW